MEYPRPRKLAHKTSPTLSVVLIAISLLVSNCKQEVKQALQSNTNQSTTTKSKVKPKLLQPRSSKESLKSFETGDWQVAQLTEDGKAVLPLKKPTSHPTSKKTQSTSQPSK